MYANLMKYLCFDEFECVQDIVVESGNMAESLFERVDTGYKELEVSSIPIIIYVYSCNYAFFSNKSVFFILICLVPYLEEVPFLAIPALNFQF